MNTKAEKAEWRKHLYNDYDEADLDYLMKLVKNSKTVVVNPTANSRCDINDMICNIFMLMIRLAIKNFDCLDYDMFHIYCDGANSSIALYANRKLDNDQYQAVTSWFEHEFAFELD